MLKRFRWATLCVALAGLFSLLPVGACEAQAQPPQGQNAVQSKEPGAQEAAPPSDSVTVPDGTPFTLRLEKGLSSATAKVGDPVEFTTAYSVRVDGLVVVPKGMAVTGTVVRVNHAHRPVRNAQVYVKVEKLTLPTGELLTFRPRLPGNEKMKNVPKGGPMLPWPVYALDPVAWVVAPMLPFVKGQEQVYPPGTRTAIYLNGPVSLNRNSLPPPYKGRAQVFFVNRGATDYSLFCGQNLIRKTVFPFRLDLYPGIYLFSTGKEKEDAVQLEVHEDHQYWVERERGGLFEKDIQQHQHDIEDFRGSWGGYNLTAPFLLSECEPVQILPAPH